MTGDKSTLQELPKWLGGAFEGEDFKAIVSAISTAIQNAEQKTQGEIVPMIVRRSSFGSWTTELLGLFFICIYFVAKAELPWVYEHTANVAWDVAAVIIAILLAKLLAQFNGVQRLLLSRHERHLQVAMRAEIEFHRLNMEATSQRTGILIFVSMMERQVVVLADKGISSLLPAETWQNLVAELVSHIAQGRLKQGLIQAIERCGGLLSEHLPAQAQNPDEIANNLIIKD